MTVISTPLWLQGGTYAADDDRALLRALVSAAGCVEATGMAVLQNGTPNMTVNVSVGRVFVQRTAATDFYLTENDAVANLTISAADPTNPRRDLIVARVYDAAFSGALNQATVEVVTGTPAGSPVDPTVPANSYVLARVAVAAAAASIVTANITDLRVYWKASRPASSHIVFAASGQLTAAQLNGASALRVRCWGAGGGGGGAATTVAGNSAGAAGGGSGAYCEALIDVNTPTYPVTVTVGTGGAGGVAGANNGASGSAASSFAALVSAGAGSGGQGCATGTAVGISALCIANGPATTGDIKAAGAFGEPGVRLAAASAYGGAGASGAVGGGRTQTTAGASAVGGAGLFPGGGGGGATTSVGTQQAGGAGANGLVIVELVY